jgi:citrate lyase beta subunit
VSVAGCLSPKNSFGLNMPVAPLSAEAVRAHSGARGQKTMRSKLFVPGARGELFAKALASAADAISFDVEDSVAEGAKTRAREQVADFLRSGAVKESGKLIIVRTNAPGTAHFEGDLMAFACPGVALLNLPKARRAEDVQAAAAALADAERRNDVRQPIGLLVNVETPEALRRAAEIASAHVRVAGLQLGLADLFEGAGIDRHDPYAVQAAMFAVRMACAESGRFAYDSAFPDVLDDDGFRREAEQARRLGFVGKSCVHPRQIALANEVFRSPALDLETARRIVAAAREAATLGRGAFLVDGRMIDKPALERAQAVLAAAPDPGS